MVLDIPMHQLMGGNLTNIERHEELRRTGKIPLSQKMYINKLKKLPEERGYYAGIKKLFSETLNGLIYNKKLILIS